MGLLFLRPGYTTRQVSLYYCSVFWSEGSRDRSVHIVTRLWAGRLKNRLSILDSGKRLFCKASGPVLDLTQPPIQWKPEVRPWD